MEVYDKWVAVHISILLIIAHVSILNFAEVHPSDKKLPLPQIILWRTRK